MVKSKVPKDYFTLSLLIILITFFFIACGEEAIEMKPLEVKVTKVVAKDVPITREWVAQTLGAVDIEIRARVDGWLQGIYFTEGSEVRKGTLLYKIDATQRARPLRRLPRTCCRSTPASPARTRCCCRTTPTPAAPASVTPAARTSSATPTWSAP